MLDQSPTCSSVRRVCLCVCVLCVCASPCVLRWPGRRCVLFDLVVRCLGWRFDGRPFGLTDDGHSEFFGPDGADDAFPAAAAAAAAAAEAQAEADPAAGGGEEAGDNTCPAGHVAVSPAMNGTTGREWLGRCLSEKRDGRSPSAVRALRRPLRSPPEKQASPLALAPHLSLVFFSRRRHSTRVPPHLAANTTASVAVRSVRRRHAAF
jgi:hypothetical protein